MGRVNRRPVLVFFLIIVGIVAVVVVVVVHMYKGEGVPVVV